MSKKKVDELTKRVEFLENEVSFLKELLLQLLKSPVSPIVSQPQEVTEEAIEEVVDAGPEEISIKKEKHRTDNIVTRHARRLM